jgi:hypothetical protein
MEPRAEELQRTMHRHTHAQRETSHLLVGILAETVVDVVLVAIGWGVAVVINNFFFFTCCEFNLSDSHVL